MRIKLCDKNLRINGIKLSGKCYYTDGLCVKFFFNIMLDWNV